MRKKRARTKRTNPANVGNNIAEPLKVRAAVEQRLLSIGGSRVLWQEPDRYAELLLEQGQLWTQPVRLRRGKLHECHTNAAELWAENIHQYQMVTGYALTQDDHWLMHSWVLDGASLCESICPFQRYFGVVLEPILALHFWWANYVPRHFGPNRPPPEFWERHPVLLRLTATMGSPEFWQRHPDTMLLLMKVAG
jgi:hypothetical protein